MMLLSALREQPLVRRYWPALAAMFVFLLFAVLVDTGILMTGQRWHGWWDQGQYLRSSIAFAHGNLAPEEHWYPLLYPLLAAPFLPLLPDDPFLPLDLFCVALTAQSVMRVGLHLGIARRIALPIFLLTSFLHPGLRFAWVEPWTSTLSTALTWWLMAKAGDLVVARQSEISPGTAARFGAIAALVPLARPADMVIVLVLGGCVAIGVARQGRLRARLIAAAMAGAAPPIILYGLLHLAIYGPNATAYMQLSAEIGMRFANLGWKASILLLDPAPWFPGSEALLHRMPWLVLGVAGGIIALTARGPDGRRWYLASLLAAITAYLLVLIAYVDLLPTGLWRFNNVHYFKWIFPLLGLTTWLFAREAVHRPIAACLALAGVLAPACLHVRAVPAAPDEPARRLDFAASPGADWHHVYFARSVVTDGIGLRRNVIDYRQATDGGIVRAVALREDFAPDAECHGGSVLGTTWPPASATSPPLPGHWPKRPVARWKPQLAWGLPCWLVSCARPR
jgi:hypothetical protein